MNDRIAILGLGYVGLPLATEFAKKFKVLGYDSDPKRVNELNLLIDKTKQVDPSKLKNSLKRKLVLSSNENMLKDFNVYISTVPTPVSAKKKPDLTYLISVSKTIGKYLKKGDLVIYESTVYPGCTEEECIPVLEKSSGLTFNKDFFCGYSPERINPNDKKHTIKNIVKITSGSNKKTALFVDNLYKKIIKSGTHCTSSIKIAEAAKVIENSQRDINIAFVNELAKICSLLKIDTLDVLEAASSKWNFLNFKPGLVGGHCIGVDPYYLTYKAQSVGYHPEIILAGRRLNDGMGAYISVQLVKAMLKKLIHVQDSRVLVMGLTFKEDCPDHRIINCAFKLHEENLDKQLVLVSKDTNMRLKARSLGLLAEDYTTDAIEDVSHIYPGSRLIEDVSSAEIDMIYDADGVDFNDLKSIKKPIPNENYILRNGQKSVLAYFDPFEKKITQINNLNAYGITPRNAEQSFALNMLLDERIQLVTLSGKAGTGKTLLALACALEKRKRFRKIFLARPIVPLSNKDLGFLPGDIHSKLDPYMQPLFDNLSVIRHQFKSNEKRAQRINEMLEEEKLLITPLAYIRGRSLQKSFFIVDEAQNLTPHEIKTIITRAGEGTKVVFTGDIHQIDHPYLDKKSNGLTYLISRMKGQNVFAHITLEKGERSDLAELASNLL